MRYSLIALLILTGIQCYSKKSTGALHCLGNGAYCVFQKGADISSLFGPTYSSPSYLQLNIEDKNITVSSVRITGTATWKHTLNLNGEKIAEITDFVDCELPVFARSINASKSFVIRLNVSNDPRVSTVDNSSDYSGKFSSAILIHKERGLSIMSVYAHPYEQFHQFIARKNVAVEKNEATNAYEITVNPGQSEIYFIGGPLYQDCVENTQKILALDNNDLYNRTLKYWDSYTKKRKDFSGLLSDKLHDKQKILEQIDHVAVLLKTQQSREGAVIAGDKYHFAYVRDQYGVSRGFLAMGYYEEARKILAFYWKIWQQFGFLNNAQAIGIPGIFHIHENDEVEMTGYLIIQAFDYIKKTNDVGFIKSIFPMLQWAWNVQKKNLVKDMLPFNGDETYVAGGILPRSALNDGSAESTLLFIRSGQLLLPFMRKNHLWKRDSINADEQLVHNVTSSYSDNFISEGRIIANNPGRMSVSEMPDFRHGVCASGIHGVVYTKKDKNGNYLCPKCYAEKKEFPPIERKSYYLPSISLTPLYVGSTTIPEQIIKKNIDLIKENYLKSGQISSRPGNNTVIGYEYGFLLYALSKYKDPLAAKVFKDAMSVVDESGAWVEYYQDGEPKGCRYRPWESAINIEAVIEYALSQR